MQVKWFKGVFLIFIISCKAMHFDEEKKYQFASKLAQAPLPVDFFSFIESEGLDLNKPFDEGGNTLMHAITSCEDTEFSVQMLEQAIQLGGTLFERCNNEEQTPFTLPAKLGNFFNVVYVKRYINSQLMNELSELYDQDLKTNAQHYKDNQDCLRSVIRDIIIVQPNLKNYPSIRFCTDAIAKLGDFNKECLFINPKRFQVLPHEAQYAFIANILYQYNNPAFQQYHFFNKEEDIKRFKWEYIFKTDEVSMQKYPLGTYQLLKWMFDSSDFNNNATSEDQPAIIDRLRRAENYLEKVNLREKKIATIIMK